MKLHIRQLTRPLALLAVAATPALAGDFYVDAVNGNDGNGGTTTIDAWRTITHAVAALGPPLYTDTIHVAPGTYDAALGEQYPLALPQSVRLLGAGSQSTFLEGPASTLLSFSRAGFWAGGGGARDLTLRHAGRAIEIVARDNFATFAFSDLVIDDIQDVGVRLSAEVVTGGPHLKLNATFSRVTISACYVGVDAAIIGSGPHSVRLTDCLIHDCITNGIQSFAGYYANVTLTLDRCRLLDNGSNGLACATEFYASPPGVTVYRAVVQNSLIAGNGGSGINAHAIGNYQLDVGDPGPTRIEATHCTIANNALHGVSMDVSPFSCGGLDAMLWNSNVSGNGDDFWMTPSGCPPLFGYASNSDGGALIGQPGCIAADAMFVDPTSGDYRLSFGSPCIDSADPAFTTSPDLVGQTRSFDGNLDTIAVPDMGAMEFAPLAAASYEPGSTRLMLELSGPDYGRSILYLSDAPLLMTPETTPFGSFFLVRSTAVQLPIAHIQSRTSNLIELKIPALAVPGSTVSLQALIRSQAAPAGAAWSNPLEFVVAP